ncbi:MAG TPA: PDZ domain-containing protein [Acidobacteriota bacterium]|nr:PDZ domain-containing protein [Acidobacteriota bacterium]
MRLKRIAWIVGLALLTAGSLWAQEIHFFQRGGGSLGIEIRNVEDEDVASLRLSRVAGVVIERVFPGSAAEEAGLEPGDVILEYGGVSVLSVRQLQRLVSETPEGREVDLRINRDGSQQTVMARVGSRRGSSVWSGEGVRPRILDDFDWNFNFDNLHRFRLEPGEGKGQIFIMSSRPLLGISVVPLTEQLADFLQVPDSEGLLVTEVRAESPAAEAGLQAGDVIVELNGEGVGQPHRLSLRLKAGQVNDLRIYRRGQPLDLSVDIEESSPRPRGQRRL